MGIRDMGIRDMGIRAPAEIVAETRRGTMGNGASIATIGPY
jgi:hypothetical protein